MVFENIVNSIFPAANLPSGRLTHWISTFQRDRTLNDSGLHIADPDRYIHCPLLKATGAPIQLIEGFRYGRYANSALFHENQYEMLTSISCRVPPFVCSVRQGVPRLIKSPVTLSLAILSGIGNADLLSDGNFIYSRKFFRGGPAVRITGRQIEEIVLLGSLIDTL